MNHNDVEKKLDTLIGGEIRSIYYDYYGESFGFEVYQGDDVENVYVRVHSDGYDDGIEVHCE